MILALGRDSTEDKVLPMSKMENRGRGRGNSKNDFVRIPEVVSIYFRILNF
jgi:hypothetical protein